VQELIAKGRPISGVSGEDGSEFDVVFPEGDGPRDEPERPARPARPKPSGPLGAKPDAAP
jgi:hypothetical protein